MKYQIIGSEAQVAATETQCRLATARRLFKPAQFTNGHKALVVAEVKTQRDARNLLNRSNSALAFVSGRLGRWLTPSFVIVHN